MMILWLVVPLGFMPQGGTDCAVNWTKAETEFREGGFEEVITLLEGCLPDPDTGAWGKGLERDDKIEMLTVLGQAHLAIDHMSDAVITVDLLLSLDPNYVTASNLPKRFRDLVIRRKLKLRAGMITSVSKSGEDISEAPATVIVLTGEQIRQRGYTDLEQVLHDLPGFDLTTGNGDQYVSIYPRGFRGNLNDTMLLRFDGIEQNDIFSNSFHMSRQYPIASIHSIIVVYGPVSSLYGPNAYMGVIDVITRDPALDDRESPVVAEASYAGGSLDTRYLDLNISGVHPQHDVTWSVIGRWYRAEEHNLEDSSFWEKNIEYWGLEQFHTDGYHDSTSDQFLQASIHMGRFKLGWQSWQIDEGNAGWFTPIIMSNLFSFDELIKINTRGNRWSPKHQTLFMKYTRQFGKNLNLFFLSRYKQHELDRDKSSRSILFDDIDYDTGEIQPSYWWYFATQLRNEVSISWTPSDNFSVVAGIELRYTNLPAGIKKSTDGETWELIKPAAFKDYTEFNDRDLGVYTQLTYTRGASKWIVGGRLDTNESRNSDFDFGQQFSPRLAWVYHPDGPFNLKAIYARTFRNPSIFETISAARYYDNNPNYVGTTRVLDNLELNAGLRFEKLTFDAALFRFQSTETQFLGSNVIPGDSTSTNKETASNVTSSEFDVGGIQANAIWQQDNFRIFANTSFYEPSSQKKDSENKNVGSGKRIADIADWRLNLGVQWSLMKNMGVNIRANHVGRRQRGGGTTIVPNLNLAPNISIPAYTTLQATFTASLPESRRWGALEAQLIGRNLLDETYIHPGVHEPDGIFFASEIEQPGRTIHLRINYRFP